MVSTRSRTADVPPVVPTVEVGDPGPASEISRILEAQARMQQEFAEYKKRNADEMEALREENSRLRQKIEEDQAAEEPGQPRSRAEFPPNSRVAPLPNQELTSPQLKMKASKDPPDQRQAVTIAHSPQREIAATPSWTGSRRPPYQISGRHPL